MSGVSLTPRPRGEAFRRLPFEDQKLHLRGVAQRALRCWGYPEDSTVELLNITENATYRVEAPGMPRIALRVHRLDYAEADSIRTEVDWLHYLRNHSRLTVVEPLAALDGTFVQTIATDLEPRHVVAFAFAGGRPPRDSQDDTEDVGRLIRSISWLPRAITVPLFGFAALAYDWAGRHSSKATNLTADDAQKYRNLGRIAALVHTEGARWSPPPFYRRLEWNWDATFGRGWNNYYGMHYRDAAGLLSPKDLAVIDACVAVMHRRVDAYGQGPDRWGMIHSDLRLANLLDDGRTLTVLDFDDCGRGWYLYDVACITGFQEHRFDLGVVLDQIVEGYREVRPLSVQERKELQTFVVMRRIGLLQALLYHIGGSAGGEGESTELSPEILSFYAKGTVVLARRYLEEFEDLPLPFPPVGWSEAVGALG